MEILNKKQSNQKNLYNESFIFNKVDELIDKKQFSEALFILDSISQENPNYQRALYTKSMILSILQKNDESFEIFQKSISYDDNDEFKEFEYEYAPIKNSDDFFNYGLTSYYFGDYSEAIDYFDLSLKIQPNQSETVYYKSLSLGGLGEFEKAIKVIEKAIDLDCSDHRFWNDKGAFLSELGEFKKAHECFNKSINLKSDSYNWANKAVLYHKCNKYQKALECYDNSIKLNSRDVYPVIGKAKIYMELEDYENAEKYFKMAGEIDDTDLEYLTEIGKFMLFKQDYDEAIYYFDRCLRFDNGLSFVWMFKAMALNQLGKTDEMQRCIDRAYELDPLIQSKFDNFFQND